VKLKRPTPRGASKKKEVEEALPPPLNRAEAVKPSWFDETEAEEAEEAEAVDPTWQLGEDDFDEDEEGGDDK